MGILIGRSDVTRSGRHRNEPGKPSVVVREKTSVVNENLVRSGYKKIEEETPEIE